MIRQPDNLPDDQIEVWQQALEYFQRAYRYQLQGDIASAIRDYRLSIRLFPTAEAHTCLGWAYSTLNLYAEAIAECRLAIEIDPLFGNPYHDIGANLLELERPDEAIPWLEKAIDAPRYDARVFAYFNLGRAHELRHAWYQALEFYQIASTVTPDYKPAHAATHRLLGKLN